MLRGLLSLTAFLCCLLPTCLAESPRGLFLMNADGSALESISPRPDIYYGSPSFSPDGKQISFDAWFKHGDYGGSRIFVMDLATRKLTELGPGAFPNWSSDNQIIYRTHRGEYTVAVSRLDGSGVERLPIRGNSPRLSPDGRYVAFFDYSVRTISFYDAARDQKQSVHGLGVAAQWGGCWAPDGARFCFPARSPNPLEGAAADTLVIVDFDDALVGESKIRYSTGEIGGPMSWSPQGDKILFFGRTDRSKKMQLYTIAAGGDDDPTRVPGQDAGRDNMDATWSPDGTQIAFTSEP